MDDVLDDLHRIVRRCESASKVFERDHVSDLVARLRRAANEIGEAWSGGWFGRTARIYKQDLKPAGPHDHFDTSTSLEWPVSNTRGEWALFAHDQIVDEIYRRAQAAKGEFEEITRTAREAATAFDDSKVELLPLLDALLSAGDDKVLQDLREQAAKLKDHISASDVATALSPKQFIGSQDLIAEGRQVPPHIAISATIFEQTSYADQCKDLCGIARHAASYLEKRQKLKGRTVARTVGPIFIGHGRAKDWLELRNFLHARLHLEVIDFNSESAAGLPTQERLNEMLDRSVFAFLVMTAEDQHADGSRHARENVIHEVGLFQGRLSFRRAIILLEEGCTEFSNIVGLTTIRYAKGKLLTVTEEIRAVLEREKVI